MNLDYVQHLHKRILTPLIRGVDGISETVSILKGYHFLREDLDSIEELAIWPNRKRLVPTINSHVMLYPYETAAIFIAKILG